MSIASALFAPAAPVSTGTTTAASGAETNEAGLFSSKIAVVLDAGLGGATNETSAPASRLTTAKAFSLVQPQTFEAAAVVSADATVATDTVIDEATPPLETTMPLLTLSDEPAIDGDDANEASDVSVPVVAALLAPQTLAVAPLASLTPQPTVEQAATDQSSATDTAKASSETPAPVDIIATLNTAPSIVAPTQDKAEPAPTAFVSASTTNSEPVRADAAKAETVAAPEAAKPVADVRPPVIAPLMTADASTPMPGAVQKALEDTAADIGDAKLDLTAPLKASSEAAAARVAQPKTAETASTDPATVRVAQDIASPDGQTAQSDSAKPAAASPIAQVMAAAKISAAQVQVAVQAPKPALMVPTDVAAAVVAADLSIDTDQVAADQPAEATIGDKTPVTTQAGPSLRPARHELAQQTSNAAQAPAQTEAAGTEPTAPAKPEIAAAQPTVQPVKVADAAVAATPAPVAALDAAPTAAAPTDTQAVQQAAAPSHDLGLSTLSRATVETTAQLAAQIARRLDSRSTRFDMVLTPEDLGRVDVSLEIGKDGQLSARLAFDNPAAAADLKGRADELRRQLQEAGFQVAGDALDFSQRDPSTGGGAFERQQQRNALFAGGSHLAAQADMPIVPAPGAWINHSLTPDRVDLKV